MQQNKLIKHDGWDRYYKELDGQRAWNGVPDEYLMSHFNEVVPSDKSIVLDVASGDGRNSEPFLRHGCNVVSIDLSPSALESFKNRCHIEDLNMPLVISGDFLSLGFIESQFKCIVCFNSIPHFSSSRLALEKISSLLTVGGRAIFNAFTPNDVAFGLGNKVGENQYSYKDTLFTFMLEDEVKAILPSSVKIVCSETRQWQEPDHGSYRTGTHTHEACFFIIEKM